MCLALPALGEEEQADLVDGAAPTDASERFPASRGPARGREGGGAIPGAGSGHRGVLGSRWQKANLKELGSWGRSLVVRLQDTGLTVVDLLLLAHRPWFSDQFCHEEPCLSPARGRPEAGPMEGQNSHVVQSWEMTMKHLIGWEGGDRAGQRELGKGHLGGSAG